VTSVSAACATLGPMSELSPPSSSGAASAAFTADDLVGETAGRLLRRSSRPVRGGAVDSRLVLPDQLFFALRGERTDGHRFLTAAVRAGASALVITEPPADLDALGDVTILFVPDALAALHALATAWRRRFDPLVVGVTGSIAKTSTKEAIAAVLSRRLATLKTEGNQNNEIGMPLAVLALRSEHRAAVLEMGMYVGGEIADLARIARPEIGVVTTVQGVHLSRIGSLDAIEAAKAELVEALPTDGTAILNADDPRVRRMAARTAATTLTYGFAADADVRADDVVSLGFEGMGFTLRHRAGRRAVRIPGLGRLAVHNALAAAAVGLTSGLDEEAVIEGLAVGWTAPHRGEVVRAGGVTIVDDAYNASPGAVRAALDALAGLPGRRIAVLGEMLELGEASDAGHREVGEAAAGSVDLLVVVGGGAAGIIHGAAAAGLPADRRWLVDAPETAIQMLLRELRPGDVVLVKASRGAELEHVVEGLISGLDAEGRR
jgi:UDP-N-acetylmuramoyl-tripeptide--D-alanyl-D-alanine ligase